MATMRRMAGHEKRVDQAERRMVLSLAELGREVRLARLNHDLAQRTVARAAGISHTTLGRIERGEATGIHLADLARTLAVVGLDLSMRAYPSGSVLRDTAHVQLLEQFRRRLGQDVRWRTEVPLPNRGDRRSWDGLATVAAVRVGVEAETRARDAQELERRLNGKRRDGAVDHVILLLADTRHNRAFLRAAGVGFLSAFPVSGRVALERLSHSEDPGGSAVVLLPLPRG